MAHTRLKPWLVILLKVAFDLLWPRWQKAQGDDTYLDIGTGEPRMKQVDSREDAFMATWRDQVLNKIGLSLSLTRSLTRN